VKSAFPVIRIAPLRLTSRKVLRLGAENRRLVRRDGRWPRGLSFVPEYVAEEHRREEEHDLAERVRTDKELAGYRAAMYRPVGFYVHSSVGEDGTNDPEDVKRVAKRLHELGFLDTPTEDLDAIGDAIYAYQSSVLRMMSHNECACRRSPCALTRWKRGHPPDRELPRAPGAECHQDPAGSCAGPSARPG
jgi:hypothetical protein